MPHRFAATTVVLVLTVGAGAASAQSLGTFRWQLQPFCNIVTVTVIQQGAVYTVNGYDDQCGAPQRAPLVGLATPNPDGTIGLGLHVVTVPGGRGLHIDARISLATLAGPWSDSAGNTGTFAFGAGTGGSPRPLPTAAASPIPSTFALLPDGGFLARGTGAVGSIPASGPGFRMMWHPSKAAFRAGNVGGSQWDDVNIGYASTAMGAGTMASGHYGTAIGFGATAGGDYSFATGNRTTASGASSAAMGANTMASGPNSTALGLNTVASGLSTTAMGNGTAAGGEASTAMGFQSTASGSYSTAMGYLTTASGPFGLAAGRSTTASGNFSTAMGFGTSASGESSTAMGLATHAAGSFSTVLGTYAATSAAGSGSFVYGDRSTLGAGSGVVTSISPNQFLVRAAGGVVFWSSAGTTFPTSPGVALFTGDSAWSTLSDVDSKENFTDLAGETVLARLAQLPVREWNYKAQGAAVRHVGPTAQDFHAAFGLGVDPRRISTVDADGIALAAVKALEARTRELSEENRALHAALKELRRELQALRAGR